MVTNELYLRGRKKDVNALLNEIISDDELTFDKIMPIPPVLDGVMCTQPNPEDILLVKKEQNNECLTSEEKERLDSETRDDITTMEDVMLDAPKISVRDLCLKSIKRYEKTGAYTWADWCLIHWGTRKPVYRSNLEILINTEVLTTARIEFDTCDFLPSRFLLCLAKLHPNVSIKAVYDVGGDEEQTFTLPLDTEKLKEMHKKALNLAKQLQQ